MFAEDYVRHDLRPGNPPPGPQGMSKITDDFRRAFPDLHFSIDLMVRRRPRRGPLEGRRNGSRSRHSAYRLGLSKARADGASVFLEPRTARNVPLYERMGFRIVEDTNAPGGGPHMWFMRWDP